MGRLLTLQLCWFKAVSCSRCPAPVAQRRVVCCGLVGAGRCLHLTLMCVCADADATAAIIMQVIPELNGKLTGMAFRVPTQVRAAGRHVGFWRYGISRGFYRGGESKTAAMPPWIQPFAPTTSWLQMLAAIVSSGQQQV